MPGQLDIHAETLRSEVMHDLGEHARGGHAAPTRNDALAYATYRGTPRGISREQIAEAARQAYRDWRATQRARELGPQRTIGSAFLGGLPQSGNIGVRVFLKIAVTRPDGTITYKTVTVLVNVAPGVSIGDIKARARADWEARTFQGPRYSQYKGDIVEADIVQIVETPYPQAQVTYE